jgi:hypothetical protein
MIYADPKFDYYWRVRSRLPDRFEQKVRVLIRGGMNSCYVEFEDGFRAVTSRNYLRRVRRPRDRDRMTA